MIISLGRPLPKRLLRPYPEAPDGPSFDTGLPPRLAPLFGLAPGGVCHAIDVTTKAVSSYLAVSPLPAGLRWQAVYFLLHFPWGRPRSPLATTLPTELGLSSPPQIARRRDHLSN